MSVFSLLADMKASTIAWAVTGAIGLTAVPEVTEAVINEELPIWYRLTELIISGAFAFGAIVLTAAINKGLFSRKKRKKKKSKESDEE